MWWSRRRARVAKTATAGAVRKGKGFAANRVRRGALNPASSARSTSTARLGRPSCIAASHVCSSLLTYLNKQRKNVIFNLVLDSKTLLKLLFPFQSSSQSVLYIIAIFYLALSICSKALLKRLRNRLLQLLLPLQFKKAVAFLIPCFYYGLPTLIFR